MFLQLLESGWRPRLDTTAFIEWDRREYNTFADHAANAALDVDCDCESLSGQCIPCHISPSTACIQLCSDGAKRGSGKAAAGMALLSHSAAGSPVLLRRSGKRIHALDSSFLAELLALEWCLDVFLDYVTKSA